MTASRPPRKNSGKSSASRPSRPSPRPVSRPGLAVRLRNYFFAGVLIAAGSPASAVITPWLVLALFLAVGAWRYTRVPA